jgi:hypothetical protein
MDKILIVESLDFSENFNKFNVYLSHKDFNFDVIIIKSLWVGDYDNITVNLPLGLKLCIVDTDEDDVEKYFKIPFGCVFKVLDENRFVNSGDFVYYNIGNHLTNYNYKTAIITHIKYNFMVRNCDYDYDSYRNKKYKLIKIINKKPYLVY